MPRLGSKKSRNGCRQCKARRVKCNEQIPCSSCRRYGVDCSLLAYPASSQLVDDRASSTVSGPSSSNPSPAASSGAAVPVLPTASSACRDSAVPRDGWMDDLELMHHYTAHAYLTVPGNDQAKQTWGFMVTQEAFRHKFLMHCILAFSASHLAYIEPQSRSKHRIQASSHQSAAIAEINQVLLAITPLNCHALFAATSLITLTAFAESTSNTVGALLEVFQLLRGMNLILKDNQDIIWNGPFNSIFQHTPDPSRPLPPLLSSCMVQLRMIMEDTRLCSSIAFTAAEQLVESLQSGIYSSAHIGMRAVMFWPIKVDQAFIDAAAAQEDEDVIRVMQQYLRIINLAGTEFWFMSSWRDISC
ncbi:hypothetical protein DPSP01_010621 [Paraphaeosphaeria sporulosa]|uniref:Zn(2)-C6 fungal-type domain-containing protein n=1 Tax=Paraphaeosphaeria sporulosa TaxID=1460663 RepID=A0A177CLW1_9PLEO|nr:uncharacterized protein CC84DRAFT_521560 [Paraphaeosphaeria sporulosa]OAG07840.1 hypothetical protein CC84DRAFT_521560 [Paraphaeosphaeria sporulosa]